MTLPIHVNDHASALAFLFDRINYERMAHIPYRTGEFRLDRMRELLRRLGNPHEKLPVVHIAGTKGKGSTASMIASVLQRAGYQTGLYTSPHLEHLEERYVLNGVQISPHAFVQLVQQVEPVVREFDQSLADDSLRGLTFFELTTAMAFLYFVQQKAEIAVVEVGLGGRLDSTNVCQPVVCAITSISFDHTKQLGNTLAAIAREKAGIIKPNIPVVSGVTADEPRHEIEVIAQKMNAPLLEKDRDFRGVGRLSPSLGKQNMDFVRVPNSPEFDMNNIALSLMGEHQVENAAVAITVLQELNKQGWHIAADAILTGLSQVQCTARIEIVQQEPLTILDTAHNMASIQALCKELERSFPQRPRVLIFATSRDKDARGMLTTLLPLFDQVIFTKYMNNPRARSIEELVQMAQEIMPEHRSPIHIAETPEAALHTAHTLLHKQGLLCITGSFFLAAELRQLVKK